MSVVKNLNTLLFKGDITNISGDRILDISVSCENMVYEDALHILSYASPYPVKLRIRRTTANDPLDKPGKEVQSNLLHPLYRSSSMDDLSRIGKDGQSPGVHVINEDLQQKSVTVEVMHIQWNPF